MRALVDERDAIEQQIAGLKLKKDRRWTAPQYDAEMEKLLTDLALKTKAIRELAGEKGQAVKRTRRSSCSLLLAGVGIALRAAALAAAARRVRRAAAGRSCRTRRTTAGSRSSGCATARTTAFTSQRLPWSHDYPLGEQHFMKIVNELSYLNPHIEETNILAFDDPELFKYPVAYLAEPGYWVLDRRGSGAAFRAYLQKGGFVIFDDFATRRRLGQLRGADGARLPRRGSSTSTLSHPIFHCFFEIESLDMSRSTTTRPADLPGVFEDNDPSKRIMMMINYNTDISEFWEFSDTGLRPIDESNEAYKLGVNYIIYGMTH